MQTLVHAGAIAYGITLVAAAFIRHPVIEALRIDTLFLPGAGDRTRFVNPIVGLTCAGYALWALIGQ